MENSIVIYNSLIVLSNQGSDNIRGIMLHSPNPITMQLHAKAFKRMKNLKFLIVRNVHISQRLKYLPNKLRLLEWNDYHFSLPSKYRSQRLVALKMSRSYVRLEKLFKQV